MVVKPTLGMSPSAAPAPAPNPTRPSVAVASVNSRFDPASLTAPAGTAFDIRFENKDSGIPHNVALFTDSSASRSLLVGETFAGPATRVYSVPALDAGTYFFRCDVHASTMTGSLEVG
jgi:plastocyanin